MNILGLTIHRGICQGTTTLIFREGRDRRTPSQAAHEDGHTNSCERVTHPNSLHPCSCGREEEA